MNMKDLQIFHTVANCGSINQAAKQLNYVQSNVTSRIKKLEQSLNTILFHRHQKGITLTNEGHAMLPYAKKILSLVEEMKMISSDSENPTGKLDIASVETVIKLPYILSRYLDKYDLVDLTLSTGVTAELKEKVMNYELDGAFVTKSEITNDPNLHQMEVFHEKLVLISNNTDMSMEDIIEKPILRFSDGCGYRQKLNEWLHDQQIIPKKVMELGTLETTLGSVISGLGVAYVPYAAVEEYVKQHLIHCYELPEKYSHITTVFIYRQTDHHTPALKKFIDTIEEVTEFHI
ncbi:MAG TPA: LysR family transcriptional regulator [Candidatus Pseudogracilibacillus intestinigallinarum]|uniref:LysR family transcriptional regulator n=1 Tax=Candidatus Pseudogracilibacillus intestinigallinarum TaxID=2838742 RepID=A0A9D1PM35_9BACI|nr:LysR family transcriptional regulator [Candidatus Pseudogracilibacillus intestinigallinarum]